MPTNELTSTYAPATLLLSAGAFLLAVGLIRRARTAHAPEGVRGAALSVGVHVLLVCALFAEAILRGWTLAAPLLLLKTWPWAAYPFDAPSRPPNPMTVDLALQFGPWLEHIRTRLTQAALPLWNPLSGAGEPFVALYQSAIFSPFTLLGALAPRPYGLLVIGVLQLLAGSVGMLVLLRGIGLSSAAALVGSTAWLFNSFTIGWLGWPFASVACLLPWLVWAVHQVLARPDRRRLAMTALICGLVIVAGHPETAFKTSLVVGAFAVAGLMALPPGQRAWRGHRGAALRVLIGAALAGVLLAAVQVGPFLEYLPETGKLEQRRELINASYTPRKTMVVAWVPDFFGPPTGPWEVVANREGTPTNYLAQLLYPGVAIWLLASVGVVAAWHRWPVKALAVAGILAAAFKYGTPGLLQLVRHLPTPLPYFSVDVVFCAVVLGAWGFDALWRAGDESPPHVLPVWPAALMALSAAVIITISVLREREILQQMSLWPGTLRGCISAVVLVGITLTLIVARQRRWVGPRVFALLVFAALIVDLVGFARGYQRLAPPALQYPRVPEIDAISADPGLFRVVGLDDTLPPNSLLPFGLASVRTYDGVGGPRRFNVLIDRALGVRAERVNMPATRSPSHTALDLLNVKYIVGPPDLELPAQHYERLPAGRAALYRNVDVLARAFLIDRYMVQPDDDAAAEALVDGTIDVRRTAILPEEIPASYRPEADELNRDRVDVRHYRDDFIELEVSSVGPKLLLLTDLYAAGWSATVDANDVPLFRADVAFRAVPVPAGRHIVRFHYAPRAFRLGAWVSVLTAAALASVAASSFGPRRSSFSRVTSVLRRKTVS
ncbi:MAG: YfhO family protein [Luteitalea sp.]|nr:YfhO family protein [Luteitalea sp.]